MSGKYYGETCPPNWEREIVDGKETGRVRPTQFRPTPRNMAVPPSRRIPMPFLTLDEWEQGRENWIIRRLGA